jgi:adenine-specific DNA-methyltransferase
MKAEIASIEKVKKKKNKYGQYFTPPEVAEFMISLSNKDKKSKILEPSCGEGVFLDILETKGFKNVLGCEVDKTLSTKRTNVIHQSFITSNFKEKFDLIIGNPPYIRWSNLEDELKTELESNQLWNKYFNSLCDYLYIFILKSIELLNDSGELIFICPEYWLNTTHSVGLRNYMTTNGSFEVIYYFNETPIFKNVSVSFIIFKYIKGAPNKPTFLHYKFNQKNKLTKVILDDIENHSKKTILNHFKLSERWIFADKKDTKLIDLFELSCIKKNSSISKNLFDEEIGNIPYYTIGDICDIGNGLVSGLDKAFQIKESEIKLLNEEERKYLITVAKAKNLESYLNVGIQHYFLIPEGMSEETFTKTLPFIHGHLHPYKDQLSSRYNYNREIKYWEWVFLRNYNLFNKKVDRILVPCKERISNKDFFRFSLVSSDIYPTQDVAGIFKKEGTKESIEYITAFLNNHRVFNWLKNKGIVKGSIVEFSEKPIASIPFRCIDWSNKKEVEIHNNITQLTRKYIDSKKMLHLDAIHSKFDLLLKNG